MGWVGVGVLIASVSYILYKHPPGSWTFAPWAHPTTPENLARGKDLQGGTAQSDHASPTDDRQSDKSSRERNNIEEGTEASRSISPEGTPKATTAPLPPALEVPSLSLDGSSNPTPKEEEKTERRLNVPETRATPSNGQPTTTSAPPQPSSSPTPTPSPPKLTPPSTSMAPPAQKTQNLSVPSKQPNLMPPPPRPSGGASLRPPPSVASSLRAPPSVAPGTSTLAPPISGPQQKSSRKVTLEPGHSPLDWAALTSNPRANLRGANLPSTLIRVPPSLLATQNGRKGKDAWTSFRGKVYNITPYIPFHPGGKGEIMRGAGRDSETLFMEIHPWVNWDGMLGECLVGILGSENDEEKGAGLDEMD